MSTPNPEELEPEHTEGFKVGEKKTIDEYNQLGMSDSFQLFAVKADIIRSVQLKATPHSLVCLCSLLDTYS